MSTELDCRGLACPQPVINTKKALDKLTEGVLIVKVDNAVAKENVSKFAVSQGCGLSIEQQGQDFSISITKGKLTDNEDSALKAATVILFSQNMLGHGSEELGSVLIKSFMFTLTQSDRLPKTLLFINSGVKLTVAGSPVLEHLQVLAEQGVEILSCGTCLDFYNLKEKLAVGSISNMYSILDTLTAADKAITL